MRLAIASPSPVPPFFFVIDELACWNSSKIFACSASAMPGPVSRTATVNEPLAAKALIATSPVSVNLIALPTRLSSTCVSLRSSPRAAGRCGGTSTLSAICFSLASASTAL